MTTLDVCIKPGESDLNYLLRLGPLYTQAMAKRFTLLSNGQKVAHDMLCEVTRAIETEQKRVLTANPSLILEL